MLSSIEQAEGLSLWVRDAIQRTDDLPVFPWVASQLIELVERPDVEIDTVEELISRDAGLTSQLLRTANSALFRGTERIESVADGVRRIGLRETRNIALTAACRSLFDVEDRAIREVYPDLWKSVWHDALLCAYGGSQIAREEKRGDPDRIFSMGLFRNIGNLIVLKCVSSSLVSGRVRRSVDLEERQSLMSGFHQEAGAIYLQHCVLPESTIEAASFHHEFSLPSLAQREDLEIVRVADGLIEEIGIAPFAMHAMPEYAVQSAAELELDDARLEYYALQLRGLAEQLESLL
jgi:HD-like signal output (HDOD) protein